MKTVKKEDFGRAGKALAAAYHEKERAGVGALWQTRVMSHIRRIGPLYPQVDFFELFQRLVWRIAPAAFVLVCLLAVFISRYDFVSGYEISKMLTEDPADFSLLALYIG